VVDQRRSVEAVAIRVVDPERREKITTKVRGGTMSDKERNKKDGQNKDKKNRNMKEAVQDRKEKSPVLKLAESKKQVAK
jgi:hypothetical protein